MEGTKKPLYTSLYLQVIVAIVIGVLLGHFLPQTGEAMKPLGDGFIKLIKMIIAPIIFCTVVVNIVQPGVGMNVDPATLDQKGIAAYTKPGQMASTTDFLLNVIPNTVIDAFAKGEILQVLLFA